MAQEGSRPTISIPEGIIFISLNFIVDIVELAGVLIGIIPIIGWGYWAGKIFITFFIWAITQLWLILKGVKGTWFFGGSVLDFISGLIGLDLPFGKTIAFAINWYVVNKKPAIAQLASKGKSIKK